MKFAGSMVAKVVLDTNVVVSAILKPNSLPSLCLELVLSGKIQGVYTKAILNEYYRVLVRSKFHFPEKLVSDLLKKMVGNGELVEPNIILEKMPSLPDPEDKKFLEAVLAGGADFIVTGNKRHFPKKFFLAKVVSPREFIDWLSWHYFEI